MTAKGDDTCSKKAAPEFDPSFFNGFVAGVVFSNVNKRLLLRLLAGALAGAYIDQNYEGIPNVKDMVKRLVTGLVQSV